jgi:sugar lactone lactonase YvrE
VKLQGETFPGKSLTLRNWRVVIEEMKNRTFYSHMLSGALASALLLLSGTPGANAGKLFVSDGGFGYVYRYSASGAGEIFATIFNAEGMAFDASGFLYVTDFNDGSSTVVGSGPAISNPSFLVFDNSGNLFVSHNGTRPGIEKIARDGSISKFATHIEPNALVFDAAGYYLYTGESLSETVIKYAPDGTGTTFATGFSAPLGLAFDAAGNLFVSDLVDRVIYKVAPDGSKTTFATGLRGPVGIKFDQGGNLFVADYPNVLKFTPDGSRSTFATGIIPWDLAFRP